MKRVIEYQIRLSYPPISVRDFSAGLNKDPELIRLTERSFFYIIVQRPILSFEKLNVDNYTLNCQIKASDNDSIVKVKLPLIQQKLFKKGDRIYMKMETDFEKLKFRDSDSNPTNVHRLRFYIDEEKSDNHVFSISPESILLYQNSEFLDYKIEGEIESTLQYKAHYIGISTEQPIINRLSAHSNLQKILSQEIPLTKETILSQELAIMFFELGGETRTSIIQKKKRENIDFEFISGTTIPSEKDVFKDAEKAFVKLMKPNYNKIQFKSYPNKKSLFSDNNYIFITYEIVNNLILNFENATYNSFMKDKIMLSEESNPIIYNIENEKN